MGTVLIYVCYSRLLRRHCYLLLDLGPLQCLPLRRNQAYKDAVSFFLYYMIKYCSRKYLLSLFYRCIGCPFRPAKSFVAFAMQSHLLLFLLPLLQGFGHAIIASAVEYGYEAMSSSLDVGYSRQLRSLKAAVPHSSIKTRSLEGCLTHEIALHYIDGRCVTFPGPRTSNNKCGRGNSS